MTSRHTNVTESIFHVNWDGHNHRFNGAGHDSRQSYFDVTWLQLNMIVRLTYCQKTKIK
jgi:hypothetical protein